MLGSHRACQLDQTAEQGLSLWHVRAAVPRTSELGCSIDREGWEAPSSPTEWLENTGRDQCMHWQTM
jgi:hypothetical protein